MCNKAPSSNGCELIGDNCIIGAASDVYNSLEAGSVVWGSPAKPHTLEKRIQVLIKKLPNIYKKIKYDNDTGFRFILHHRDDKEKELILTILLFNIPIESGKP